MHIAISRAAFGHNLPQEDPHAFAEAILDVADLNRVGASHGGFALVAAWLQMPPGMHWVWLNAEDRRGVKGAVEMPTKPMGDSPIVILHLDGEADEPAHTLKRSVRGRRL